jgi:hypothetical protein
MRQMRGIIRRGLRTSRRRLCLAARGGRWRFCLLGSYLNIVRVRLVDGQIGHSFTPRKIVDRAESTLFEWNNARKAAEIPDGLSFLPGYLQKSG